MTAANAARVIDPDMVMATEVEITVPVNCLGRVGDIIDVCLDFDAMVTARRVPRGIDRGAMQLVASLRRGADDRDRLMRRLQSLGGRPG